MTRPISIFSNYSKRENRVTNYCLLLLKMLYEENPNFLGEVLTNLLGDPVSGKIGVSFAQQAKKENSIPDGIITQPGVSVYIETKNSDWFYDAQLSNHLDALSKDVAGTKILIALGNFEEDTADRFKHIQELVKAQYKDEMIFSAASFEDLLAALQVGGLEKNLLDAIADFQNFLNEEDLLPSWKKLLDVISCGAFPDDVLKGGVYMCPAAPGAYNHDRCKYFGMYRDKRVEKIALIEAVVDIHETGDEHLKWKNVRQKDKELKHRAREIAEKLRPGEEPTRVFLLGELFDTDFRKDSSGGMRTKTYFNIEHLEVDNAEELAEKLHGKVWSEFK
jgi:hypothetical protein